MKNNFTVSAPKAGVTVGAIDAIAFGLFILLRPFMWPNVSGKSLVIFHICFGSFVLFGLYLMIKSLRVRIVVKNEQLTAYPLMSKSYTFTFSDIDTVTRQFKKRYEGYAERIIIRTKRGKKFIVDSSYFSYRRLVKKISECIDESKLIGQWEELSDN